MLAAHKGHVAVIELLLWRSEGTNPGNQVTGHCLNDMIRTQLRALRRSSNTTFQDAIDTLFVAAYQDQAAVVEKLISLGLDVETQNYVSAMLQDCDLSHWFMLKLVWLLIRRARRR